MENWIFHDISVFTKPFHKPPPSDLTLSLGRGRRGTEAGDTLADTGCNINLVSRGYQAFVVHDKDMLQQSLFTLFRKLHPCSFFSYTLLIVKNISLQLWMYFLCMPLGLLITIYYDNKMKFLFVSYDVLLMIIYYHQSF